MQPEEVLLAQIKKTPGCMTYNDKMKEDLMVLVIDQFDKNVIQVYTTGNTGYGLFHSGMIFPEAIPTYVLDYLRGNDERAPQIVIGHFQMIAAIEVQNV